ncbi:ankyrin repeat domain-containing protein 17-like [Bolinopsis microptera]|uniref:ankyrin repeat domain-containing protein 17-like n=1 Tax=Bolinopsis microptera TaxID=2820187 RepID=UPI00307974D3
MKMCVYLRTPDYVNIKDSREQTALMIAVTGGHLDAVRFLVHHGADIDIRDSEDCTAISHALENDNHVIFRYLLDGEVAEWESCYSFSSKHTNNALLEATKGGKLATIKYLVNVGLAVENRQHLLNSSMVANAGRGAKAMVEELRFLGAEMDFLSEAGYTGLMSAAAHNRLEMLPYLLDSGADINQTNQQEDTALIFAAVNNHLETVVYLLEIGVDINQTNNSGNTVLIAASANNCLKVVIHLLESGVEINFENKRGFTALSEALLSRKPNVAAYLCGLSENKVNVTLGKFDVESRDDGFGGQTVLMWAVQMDEVSIVKYLVEMAGADVKVRDDNGYTATEAALKDRKPSVATYLCGLSEAKAELGKFDIDSRNKDSQTVLMWAAELGAMPIVAYLIREGADVNLKDNDGNTALSFAVNSKKFEVAHYLFLQPGIEDSMIQAAEMGQLTVVKYAVEHGLDINYINESECTALSVSLRSYMTKLRSVADYLCTQPGIEVSMIHAAKMGQVFVVKYALEKGRRKIKYVGKGGVTILSAALNNRKTEVAAYLCREHGAAAALGDFAIEGKCVDGQTVLMWAIRTGEVSIVKYLVEIAGANVGCLDEFKNTILDVALKILLAPFEHQQQKIEVADYLCSLANLRSDIHHEKFAVNTFDDNGRTVLMLGALKGKINLVRYVAEKGGRPVINYRDSKAGTALGVAMESVINIRDAKGGTALSLAMESRNAHIATYLCSRPGIELSVIYAAETGKLAVVKYAVEQGLYVKFYFDENGNSAIDAALSRNNTEVAEYLRKLYKNRW